MSCDSSVLSFLERWYPPLSLCPIPGIPMSPAGKSFILSPKCLCGWVAKKGHPLCLSKCHSFSDDLPRDIMLLGLWPLSVLAPHICLAHRATDLLKENRAPMCWPVCPPVCICGSLWGSLRGPLFPVAMCPRDSSGNEKVSSWSLQSSRNSRCPVKNDSLLSVPVRGRKA